MSDENVELLRRGFDRFMTTGEPPWEIFDDEVEVYDHDTPDQGAYRGHAGYARWLEDWGAAWAEWSIEPQEYIDAGDWVVVAIRMKTKGLGSSIEVERRDAMVWEVRASKIVRLDYYNDRKQALESVGLGD
ncbi:MAG TPA: nuclear transport factor 2 family protein [Solirubrobacteraceae bacterium]|jgi:ketosteroid isomerase-like protein|nr:nuclear transport factor 2 family protein [Solirubrobacteraceae bacterium]